MLFGRAAAAACATPLCAALASAAAHDRPLRRGADRRLAADRHWAAAAPFARRPAECMMDRVRRSFSSAQASQGEMLRRAEQLGCDHHRLITDVYTFKESVATGTTSPVRKAVHNETGARRVVKQAAMFQTAEVDRLVHEVKMLKRVGAHAKIVPMVECFVDSSAAYLVTEMCFGSDVNEWSMSFEGIPPEEEEVAKLLQDMATSVQHCHKQGVLHQDVRLKHFVFQSNDGTPNVRLIDFGCAEATDSLSIRQFGTAGHYAPELRAGLKSTAADVYSLGVAFFTMLSGGISPTFDGGCQVLAGKHFEPSQAMKSILDKCSADAKDLCTQMLAGKPEERPTLESVLEHPFVVSASAKDRVVSMDKGLRLIERAHALCQVFLDVSPDVEPPWVMHIAKGQEVFIECMVLSGLLKGPGGTWLGPGELIHSKPHMASTDVTVLNIPARTYASLNTAGKVGRRNSSASASWCTAEFVRSTERRVQVLAQLFLIMCDRPECLGPRRLTRNSILVRFGEDSDEAYVVLSGSLEVISSEGVSLAQIPPGQIVGEMAALNGQKRSATLKALDNTMVLPIPPEILKEMQEGGGGAFRYLKEAADKRDVQNRQVHFLRESDFFGCFQNEVLHEIAKVMVPKFIRAGEQVYAEGAKGDFLFLVMKGQLFEEHGEAVTTRGPGAVLGEVALVFGTARSATVAALMDCDLLILGKEDFDKLMEKYPTEKQSIVRIAEQHRKDLSQKAENAKAQSVRR